MSKKPKSIPQSSPPVAPDDTVQAVPHRSAGPALALPSAAQQREAVEPAEVLGRHRNSGQKDHKGAR